MECSYRLRTHLRHDAARRRAVARRDHDRDREARGRARARAARRRRHRGRLSGGVARRLRGGAQRSPSRSAAQRSRADHLRAGARVASDIDVAWEGVQVGGATAHPHLPRDRRHPPAAQAAHDARRGAASASRRRSRYARALCDDVEFSPEDATRTDPEFLRAGRRGRDRAPARPRSTSPTPSATRCPTSSARSSPASAQHVPGIDERRALGALPRRSRPGGRQHARRRRAPARARSSARSTASASAPATARSKRS